MLAALVLQIAIRPNPEAVMRAFWDQMDKAQALYVRILIPAHFGLKETEWQYWLEKPNRYRAVGDTREYRWDGASLTSINHAKKTYQILAGDQTPLRGLPQTLLPFFGNHDFNIAKLDTWDRGVQHSPDKPGPAISLGSSKEGYDTTWIYLNIPTALPIGMSQSTSQGQSYLVIREWEVNPQDRSSFAWPSLQGYTDKTHHSLSSEHNGK